MFGLYVVKQQNKFVETMAVAGNSFAGAVNPYDGRERRRKPKGNDMAIEEITVSREFVQDLRARIRHLEAENTELVRALNEYEEDELERRNHERQWD